MQDTPSVTDQGTEISLSHGGWTLTTAPLGASLRGLTFSANGSTQEIVAAYHGASNKVGGQGDVLIPFPGRIAHGEYSFDGCNYKMEMNDKEGPNAIHGFVRSLDWTVVAQSSTDVTYFVATGSDDTSGYPFSLETTVRYALNDDGMTCNFQVRNTSTTAAPIAAGFHPYFSVGHSLIDSWTLRVPMTNYLEFRDLIPTGRVVQVQGTEFDFREAHSIGSVKFNTCYGGAVPDERGVTAVTLADTHSKLEASIWMDSTFPYVVLYSGDPLPEPHRRRSLAIEPMTCASDGFNHPEWGSVIVAPGEILGGSWGVSVRNMN